MMNLGDMALGLAFVCATLTFVGCVQVEKRGAVGDNLPEITMREGQGSTALYWGDDEIVHLKENRWLRFRGTVKNDHWIGTERNPIDLCWEYSRIKDYENPKVAFEKTKKGFALTIRAEKPSVGGTIETKLEAAWKPEMQSFEYVLGAQLRCPLEKWHETLDKANAFVASRKTRPAPLEAFDYRINRISLSDRYVNRTPKDLYEGFVWSHDMKDWTRLPKLHVSLATRPGNYCTVNYGPKTIQSNAGDCFGFIDRGEGGWMTQILETPAPITYGICWAAFDVHVVMEGAVPPRGSAAMFEPRYRIKYWEITPGECRKLFDASKEVEWRSLPEYQLPLFSSNNKFDKMLEGNGQNVWFASSFGCSRDDTVGVDDNFSASITVDEKSKSKYAAWYGWFWGPPYEPGERIRGRYTLSAQVKTSGCKGRARIAFVGASHDYWFRNSQKPATPADWHYSEKEVTGTNDWTELSVTVEMPMAGPNKMVVLEQEGEGRSWFDNVIITKSAPDAVAR